jgi:hypothetical protein
VKYEIANFAVRVSFYLDDINFLTKIIVEPSCIIARDLLFAEIAKDHQGQPQRVGGREWSSFLNVLALDVKYLYSNTPGG